MQPTHKSPVYREKPVGYSLSNKDHARLKAMADYRGMPVSVLTRAIVMEYLKEHEPREVA